MVNHHDQWWYFYHQYLQTTKGSITTTAFVQPPAIYSEDFNCHHISWGYSPNNRNGETLHDWPHTVDLKLLFDHKQLKSFHSPAWNTHTNLDLTFYSCEVNSLSPRPIHKIGGNFPKSQYRPKIIHHPALVEIHQLLQYHAWISAKQSGDALKQNLQLSVIIFLAWHRQ